MVDNIKVEVSLEQGKIITIALSDVTLPQSTQNKIHSYIDDICKSEIRQLSGVPLIFTTVDDREVYDGESIFGRSKYVKKYNYTLDNVDEVKERLQKELIKLTDIIYSKQILNSIYMKIAKALEDVLPK